MKAVCRLLKLSSGAVGASEMGKGFGGRLEVLDKSWKDARILLPFFNLSALKQNSAVSLLVQSPVSNSSNDWYHAVFSPQNLKFPTTIATFDAIASEFLQPPIGMDRYRTGNEVTAKKPLGIISSSFGLMCSKSWCTRRCQGSQHRSSTRP